MGFFLFNLPSGNHIFHDSICAVHDPICTPFHARSQNLLKGAQFFKLLSQNDTRYQILLVMYYSSKIIDVFYLEIKITDKHN